MMIKRKAGIRFDLNTGLLSIFLLLSVFSFSGYSGNCNTNQLKSTQTELVRSLRTQVVARFSYKQRTQAATKSFQYLHSGSIGLASLLQFGQREQSVQKYYAKFFISPSPESGSTAIYAPRNSIDLISSRA